MTSLQEKHKMKLIGLSKGSSFEAAKPQSDTSVLPREQAGDLFCPADGVRKPSSLPLQGKEAQKKLHSGSLLLPDYNTVGSPSKSIHFLHRYLVNLVINLRQMRKNALLRMSVQQHCKEGRHTHVGITRQLSI